MHRRAATHLAALALLFAALSTPARAQAPAVIFTDVTDAAGLDFRYTFGDTTYVNILESSGSGVTVFDYDGDGDLDLYLLQGAYLPGISSPDGAAVRGATDRLYRNDGAPGGAGQVRFTDVTAEAGLGDTRWSMAAAALDYDGDGDVDLYQLNYGPNVFYRNDGDGTFTDVTDALGLRGPETLNGFPTWSAGAAFWDYDADGRTDVMVCNFLAFDPDIVEPGDPDMMPHPARYRGQASILYRQQADGTFVDVTETVGFHAPDAKCMGLTVWDYDDDGDLDLFQGNDHQENFLYRNDGGGTFAEVAGPAGVAVNDQGLPTGSMHGTIGDVDGDGRIDLLVVDLRYGALYRHRGDGLFEDVTRRSGVADAMAGKGAWAAFLFDVDNDGDLDLFSANGTAEVLALQPPLLLVNDGRGRFRDAGPEMGAYFRTQRSGRGAAVWDYDDDGDLDLLVSHVDLPGKPVLLRNDGGNRNHWLGLTLAGRGGAAAAVGARVSIEAGGRRQVAVHQWATSYLSYNDPRLHFGLGDAARVDRLEIRWPDGQTEVYRDLAADRYVTIVQGEGIRTGESKGR